MRRLQCTLLAISGSLSAMVVAGCDFAQVADRDLESSFVSAAMAENIRVVVHDKEPIRPLSIPNHLPKRKVMLGKALFHDVRLSQDNSISCASCHSVADGGDDGLPTAQGIDGQTGTLNSPTVLNSGLSIAQFWDGRAQTLHDQVSGPVHNPIEMGSSWEEVISKLELDKQLVAQFELLYTSGLSSESIVDAIAVYEEALVTVNAPFDQYLFGNEQSISSEAYAGYQLFKSIGCVSCHQGQAVGGNMFQEFGIMNKFSSQFAEATKSNKGRINVTDRQVDLHRFKVPSLRNIELTAPYFHDGSVETLDEAIEVMAEYQLGESLVPSDVAKLKAFLISLTGEIPEELK